MNQCIFSPERIYRYVLRCTCTESASENTSKPWWAERNPEKAQYSNTPIVQHPAGTNSRSRTNDDKYGLPRRRTSASSVESPCEGGRMKYRPSARRIAWIGLNPSTADEVTLDQTLASVCRYSGKWGFIEVVMLNLFAFRATDPRDLKLATDPIGPDNDKHLLAELCSVDRVIACWGDHGRFLGRDKQVSDLLGVPFECLLRNKTGAPHHPLYLKSSIKPKPFGLDQIRN